jgi:murein endopeptidase
MVSPRIPSLRPPLSREPEAGGEGCAVKTPPSDTPDAELRRRAIDDPCSLGSVSFDGPSDGAQLNAVRLTDGDHWVIAYPSNAWATLETVTYLQLALKEAFAGASPDTPKIYIGDLSTPWGGPLPPHASHQSGRDVDVGYARLRERDPWWADASARTLNVEVTWRLLRALATRVPVEVIFIDRSLQRLLKAHARRLGEDARWLDGLFDLGLSRSSALVRHVPGHTNHMHVRFYSPSAQHVGRVVRDLFPGGVTQSVTRDR